MQSWPKPSWHLPGCVINISIGWLGAGGAGRCLGFGSVFISFIVCLPAAIVLAKAASVPIPFARSLARFIASCQSLNDKQRNAASDFLPAPSSQPNGVYDFQLSMTVANPRHSSCILRLFALACLGNEITNDISLRALYYFTYIYIHSLFCLLSYFSRDCLLHQVPGKDIVFQQGYEHYKKSHVVFLKGFYFSFAFGTRYLIVGSLQYWHSCSFLVYFALIRIPCRFHSIFFLCKRFATFACQKLQQNAK